MRFTVDSNRRRRLRLSQRLFAAIGLMACASLCSAQDDTSESAVVRLDSIEATRPADESPAETSEQHPEDDLFIPTDPQSLFAGRIVYVNPQVQSLEDDSVDESHEEFHEPLPELPIVPESSITAPPSASSGCADEEVHEFKWKDKDDKRVSFEKLMRDPYTTYRTYQSSLSWLPAHGQHFGWLDWQSDPYLNRDTRHGLTGAINVHWLSGPSSTPLPPRLYDFVLGYQTRKRLTEQFSYDLFTSVGAYSDFEGTARKGIRFPSHAVGMFHVNHSTDVVFGIDYLGRDDVQVLPVGGVSLRDILIPGLRMDLIFPRPRIDYLLTESHRLYLAGNLNGGTWQVEFPDEANYVVTYRDLRLMFGVESADKDGSLSALEFGYVFGRRLQVRDVPGDTHFDDAFVIQWVSRH